ncbi:helix-turn-helix transcriptional regulator [Paenibacillus polymyxa]|uniref:helix-turn-helix transcriptional regulator n=1 Tax=Paenibacillus polymyxa TaxID=1406 RepID=UPI000ED8F5B0|nr:helix-turn-helix transcriptional regulator [Paenibacillus polymyxa]RGL39111.1 XRE family transcriptional regulator [Paenibacillus polymyxa]WHX37359.1 helix-turn-helix transcriptional regulator [Paenibacillus polymyxa]
MSTITIVVRSELKNCRESKGTQRKVAYELGITEAHWCAIENGKSVPGTKLLFKIAHYFGKSIYVLFPDLAHPSFFEKDSN